MFEFEKLNLQQMTRNEFINHVYNRIFAFQLGEEVEINATNRLETFTKFDEERQLMAAAQKNGADWVRILCRAISSAGAKHKKRTAEEDDAMVLFNSQGERFQTFCRQLRGHDWFYSFSDDPGVSERGASSERVLEAIAINLRGPYKTMWDHYCKKRADAINPPRTA